MFYINLVSYAHDLFVYACLDISFEEYVLYSIELHRPAHIQENSDFLLAGAERMTSAYL